jgi:outer membrane protein OmpA-like peptidoglycan-associated protein
MTRTTTLRCAVILALLVAGCAKQPSTTTGMTSPAPGGAAGSAMDPARQGTGAGAGAAQGGAAGAMGRADARPPVKDFREVPGLADVHFDYDKADIRPVDVKVLDVNAGWLKEHPDHLVLIEGPGMRTSRRPRSFT